MELIEGLKVHKKEPRLRNEKLIHKRRLIFKIRFLTKSTNAKQIIEKCSPFVVLPFSSSQLKPQKLPSRSSATDQSLNSKV